MKLTNRENIQRAIGIIEGVSYVAAERVQDALATAIGILDAVLSDEEKNHET